MLVLPPLFWAGNFVVGRAARTDVPPMMLAFARHLVALVVLLPFGWTAMRRDVARYWACRWLILRAALAGMVVFNLLVYSGLHATTASNAQLMNSTIPVLIVLLSAVLDRQRLSATQGAGLCLSCAGVLTIVLHGDLARLGALNFSHGDLMVFGAMASFALFTVWLRAFPADMDRLGLLGAQLTVAVVLLFPLVAWEYAAEGARASWNGTTVERDALRGDCRVAACQSALHVRHRARGAGARGDVHPSRSVVWRRPVDRAARRASADPSRGRHGRDHGRAGLRQHGYGNSRCSLARPNHFRHMSSVSIISVNPARLIFTVETIEGGPDSVWP